jgi:hypothetical protein
MAREWLNECLENHTDCPTHTVADLPTRLVRVSKLGEPESARLCHTQGQKGHYCALRYCWGAGQPFSTTETRYNAYLEALPYDDLPRTIRDAFHVTRSLGMQYIWIDSLCIIQNDLEDVPRELAKMLSIYLNAQFTISAAGARTCHEGFLATQQDHDESFHEGPFFLPLRADEDTMGSVLIMKDTRSWAEVVSERQPLNERAWTLQEALLTPRLLIFTNLNMVRRCHTKYEPDFCENIGSYSWRHQKHSDIIERHPWHEASIKWGYIFDSVEKIPNSPEDIVDENASDDDTDIEKMPLAPVWKRFRSMVEAYSTRKLTKQSDKLPAISALAETYASHIQCDYLAGLWRRYLVYDLMWWVEDYVEEDPNESESGLEAEADAEISKVPSWSWASINQSITFNRSRFTRAMADVVDCSVSLMSDQAAFGEVNSGQLVIRGFLKELKMDKKKGLVHDTGKIVRGVRRKEYQCWCFTLGNAPVEISESVLVHQAIILVKSEDFPGCYRRIGYLRGESAGKPAWWEQCNKVIITIV